MLFADRCLNLLWHEASALDSVRTATIMYGSNGDGRASVLSAGHPEWHARGEHELNGINSNGKPGGPIGSQEHPAPARNSKVHERSSRAEPLLQESEQLSEASRVLNPSSLELAVLNTDELSKKSGPIVNDVDIVVQSKEWGDFDSDSSSDFDRQPNRYRGPPIDSTSRTAADSAMEIDSPSEKREPQRKEESKPKRARKCEFIHVRFVVVALLGVADFVLQLVSFYFYYCKASRAVVCLLAIQILGVICSTYITFHDNDIILRLNEVRSTRSRTMHTLHVIGTFLFYGCCRYIQVKRAWAKQSSTAEIMSGMDLDDMRSSTPQSLRGFGGAERAIPVALLTDVPFLIVNTVGFLTAKWIWGPIERIVVACASVVAGANVILGIIEIDLSVSAYVFKRYHWNWQIVGTKAGRAQCLYPVAHMFFRTAEVSMRTLFLAISYFILQQFGNWMVLAGFLLDYFYILVVLMKFSPHEETNAAHVAMAGLMLLADLSHFVDQPNFTIPAKRIGWYLVAWRLLTAMCMIFVCWYDGEALLARVCASSVENESFKRHHFTEAKCMQIFGLRSWVFQYWSLLIAFVGYSIIRFSPPIYKVGDDLHTAARKGDAVRVQKLLRPDKFNQVLDVNALTKDNAKRTPAMMAAEFGHVQVLQHLDTAGADFNIQNVEGNTCLHLAASRHSQGHVDVLEYLLEKGARHDVRNHAGKTAEDLARSSHCCARSEEILRLHHDKFCQRRAKAKDNLDRSMSSQRSTFTRGPTPSTVPLVSCGSVQLQGLFPSADDNECPSPRALHSVSGLVFSRAAGLFARKVLQRQHSTDVPIGQLRRVGELGKGGFGTVIEVELPEAAHGPFTHRSRTTRFALKLQRKERSQRSAFSEALALRAIHHEFIVRLERAFQTPTYFALLLELCPNDLNRILVEKPDDGERCTGLTPQRTAKYLGQTLLALTHLHAMDVVYRDMKPENILISLDDDAKVADFGLAKVVHSTDDNERLSVCGTQGFFPPELLDEQLLDSPGNSQDCESCCGEARIGCKDRKRGRAPSNPLYDVFKLDAYSFGVTLQVTLLGEDAAVRKEIQKKGFMMLPMYGMNEEDNTEMLQNLNKNGTLSDQAFDLLANKLLPFKPHLRSRLSDPEVFNHPFFLEALGYKDLSELLPTSSTRGKRKRRTLSSQSQ